MNPNFFAPKFFIFQISAWNLSIIYHSVRTELLCWKSDKGIIEGKIEQNRHNKFCKNNLLSLASLQFKCRTFSSFTFYWLFGYQENVYTQNQRTKLLLHIYSPDLRSWNFKSYINLLRLSPSSNQFNETDHPDNLGTFFFSENDLKLSPSRSNPIIPQNVVSFSKIPSRYSSPSVSRQGQVRSRSTFNSLTKVTIFRIIPLTPENLNFVNRNDHNLMSQIPIIPKTLKSLTKQRR